MKRLLLAFLVFLAPAWVAHAACDISQFTVTGAVASYEPFANAFTPVPIAITVRGNSDCRNKSVIFGLGQTPTTGVTGSNFPATDGGQALQMAIVGAGGQPIPVSGTAAAAFQNPQITLTLGASGDLQNGTALWLKMQPGQAVPPGGYTAELKVFLCVLGSPGGCSSGNTETAFLPISVHVRQALLLAALSSQHIDVGELKPGALGGPVSFDAYANIDYDLVLTSDNNFTLAPGGHGVAAQSVPYLPLISGQPVTRETVRDGFGHAGEIGFPVPGGNGVRRHTFAVKIGSFSDLPAGTYSDVLTICIRARA